jgi:hypothetical protein
MCVSDGMTGRPALSKIAFSVAAAACCPSRSDAGCLEVPHAGERARHQHRRQARREDEARRVGADHVDDVAVGRDIAAHHADRLGQRALDDVDPVRHVVALRNPAAARAVHADGVDLVEIGEGAELLGQVADRRDRRDVPVHRIDALERDQLGRVRRRFGQQLLQMRQIVVAEHLLLAARHS